MNTNKFVSFLLVLIAIVVSFSFFQMIPADSMEEETVEMEAETKSEPEELLILLHPAELAATGITIEKATIQPIRSTRALPGRLTYDQTKHVAVRAGADGVLDTVSVEPGDMVSVGQTLAILRCPVVGMARSELMSREAALTIAEKENDWRSAIYDGVGSLADLILQGRPVAEIEEQMNQQRLGQYRATLLNAYAQKEKAEYLVQSANQLGNTGALSGRVISERRNALQQESAKLDAVLEQTLFESEQAYKATLADVESAKRKLQVSRQELMLLMGLSESDQIPLDLRVEGNDLSILIVRSPIAGTIETREYSATERVNTGAELFVVADTSYLWVEADIRGGDWSALQIKEGDTVEVMTPATGDLRKTAVVRYLGRQVDPSTGSVPLVAELSNEEGILRPGQFARIEAPTEPESNALVVPESSIVEVNGTPTVYVPKGEGFRPISVRLGRQVGGQVEILEPLKDGQAVVVTGAFFLKSEQLLTGEE